MTLTSMQLLTGAHCDISLSDDTSLDLYTNPSAKLATGNPTRGVCHVARVLHDDLPIGTTPAE